MNEWVVAVGERVAAMMAYKSMVVVVVVVGVGLLLERAIDSKSTVLVRIDTPMVEFVLTVRIDTLVVVVVGLW